MPLNLVTYNVRSNVNLKSFPYPTKEQRNHLLQVRAKLWFEHVDSQVYTDGTRVLELARRMHPRV